jgi:hypothetical protein
MKPDQICSTSEAVSASLPGISAEGISRAVQLSVVIGVGSGGIGVEVGEGSGSVVEVGVATSFGAAATWFSGSGSDPHAAEITMSNIAANTVSLIIILCR